MTPEHISAWLDRLPPDAVVSPRRVELRVVPVEGDSAERTVTLTLDHYGYLGSLVTFRRGWIAPIEGIPCRIVSWRDLGAVDKPSREDGR